MSLSPIHLIVLGVLSALGVLWFGTWLIVRLPQDYYFAGIMTLLMFFVASGIPVGLGASRLSPNQ